MRRLWTRIPGIIGLCLLGTFGAASRGMAGDPPAYAGPGNAELDAAREWLWDHPPNGRNAAERRIRMAVIQAAADQYRGKEAPRYLSRWAADPAEADVVEQCGAPYYIRRATDHALEDIRNTRVERGLAVWFLYNMGYVFKTPDACFGIDICLRDGQRLVDSLDFLLITHEHNDHWAGGLARAMIKAGKPVVSRFLPDGKVVKAPAKLRFGPVRVKIDLGDHTPSNPYRRDNMLMFEVDCGKGANHCIVYHSGDGANYEKMTPEKPVDILIPHVACSGMVLADAIRHVNPAVTLVSHVLEISHNFGGARWSYDYAFNAVKDFPEDRALVLTWGERWLWPGTVLSDRPKPQETRHR